MTGLFNRIIWVWPDWDKENHDETVEYAMNTVGLGWVSVGQGALKSRAFCMCEMNETGTQCSSMTDVGHGETSNEGDFFQVPEEDCTIIRTLIVEEIHESSALINFGKTDWLTKNEPVVLDMDEDFFGCTYAIWPILNSSLSISRVNQIDEILNANLCPRDSNQDLQSDSFLMRMLSFIRKQKDCENDNKLEGPPSCTEVTNTDPYKYFDKLLNDLVSNETITLCSKTKPKHFLRDLIPLFNRLRVQQVRAFQTTGFCANTSPKSRPTSRDERKFGTCYGANTPEETAVIEHIPSKADIGRRAVVLKGILKKLSTRKPGIVTVARSVRDGYTPRNHFAQIERYVLTALNSSMGRPLHVHYDEDLLGGKRGFPSRHKSYQ